MGRGTKSWKLLV